MPENFTVKKTPYGLYTSVDLDGKELVTSATEHQCREMTHFYLKNLQDEKVNCATTKSAKTKK